MASSKLGVMSTEDLGDGMKSTVKIETSIGSNQMAGFTQTGTATPKNNGTTIDATSLGSRELWLALATASGTTIKAGFGSTLIRDISLGYAADPGGNLVGNALNNDSTLSSNRVVGATVTQNFGVVTGTLQYSTNTDTQDGKANQENGNGYLIGLQYVDGPVSAGVAMQSVSGLNNTITAGGTTPTAGTIAPAVTNTIDQKRDITILGGSYDLGVAKLFAEFTTVKLTDNLGTATADKSYKTTYESIGVDVPFSAAMMGFVQFSAGSVDSSPTHVGGVSGASQNVTGYSLGGKYNFSKTTYAYLSVGELKLTEGTASNGTDLIGTKVDQYTIGLVKNF
jgi:predicted porin